MAITAGVVGAAGFAGIELVRLLLHHPDIELAVATSDALAGTPVSHAYPAFEGVTDLVFQQNESADLSSCDVVFLAVPHTAALGVAPNLIEQGVTVIDLSADFRLKDPTEYEEWYNASHTAPALLEEAVFGLPELNGEALSLAAARHAAGEPVLVACAGCYPTATSLAAAPALRGGLASTEGVVIVDAISGITGAGKKATERTHFCFANENAEAYGVATHRHTPEIEQILDIPGRLVFTPHLAPLNRGLLSTVNIPLAPNAPLPTRAEVERLYADYYAESSFVTVLQGSLPKTSSVVGTNRAHVGVAIHERARMLIAVCAIDNLGKGAAGQAVQCANIVLGLDERQGLRHVACAV